MRILSAPLLWVRALTQRGRVDADMEREMRFHVDMETEHNIRAGLDPNEARRQARIQFGGLERYKAAVRAERRTGWLDALGTELRIAVRTLAKRPAFAAVVVLTVAVGIGATTAVFSWAEWALFRPVPGVRDPGRVVSVSFQSRPEPNGGITVTGISIPNFDDLASTTGSFESLAAYSEVETQFAAAGVIPTDLNAQVVLANYFHVLGVVPPLGRTFASDELSPHAQSHVVMISDSLWRTTFGGRRDVLGGRVTVNGEAFTIIGVTPPGFHGPNRTHATDLWFPANAYALLEHHAVVLSDRKASVFRQLIARLRPGVPPQMAQDDLNRRLAILIAQYPAINAGYATMKAVVKPDIGISYGRGRLVDATGLLLGIVALVLLIACANVANLLLLRGVRRREEMGVRRALGASATRLLGQHLVEGLLLSVTGSAVGLGIAVLVARVFASSSGLGVPAFQHFVLDLRVFEVSMALAIGTGLVFGLAPGIAALRNDPMRDLKAGPRTHSERRAPVRAVLTVTQIGAAVALVVGALLLGRTVYAIAHVDLGFDVNQVAMFWINASPQGYPAPRIEALRHALVDRMSALPAVQAVAIASSVPGLGGYLSGTARALGDTSKQWPVTPMSFSVTPQYFHVLRIPVLRGRAFTPGEFDDTTSQAAVVSEATARALFGPGDPIGRQFEMSGPSGRMLKTVVGVVGDVRTDDPLNAKAPAVYFPSTAGPAASYFTSFFPLVVRSSRPDDELRQAIQSILAGVAPTLPVPQAQSYASVVHQMVSDRYLFARLVSVLALFAVVLATVGLYSVIAFTVADRTREIGIRIALGAQPATVVGLVVRQSAALVAVGIALGVGGAVALARLLASRLYGVTALDPTTYAVGAAAWVVLAFLATLLPARSAARIDPTIAMRAD